MTFICHDPSRILCVFTWNSDPCIIQHFGFSFSSFSVCNWCWFPSSLLTVGGDVVCGGCKVANFFVLFRVIQCIVRTILKKNKLKHRLNITRLHQKFELLRIVGGEFAFSVYRKTQFVLSVTRNSKVCNRQSSECKLQVLQTSDLFMCFIVCFWWQIFPCHCEFIKIKKGKKPTKNAEWKRQRRKTNTCCALVTIARVVQFFVHYTIRLFYFQSLFS